MPELLIRLLRSKLDGALRNGASAEHIRKIASKFLIRHANDFARHLHVGATD